MELLEIQEMVECVCSFLPLSSVIYASSVNKRFYNACNNDSIWKSMTAIFCPEIVAYKPKNESYKEQYKRLYQLFRKFSPVPWQDATLNKKIMKHFYDSNFTMLSGFMKTGFLDVFIVFNIREPDLILENIDAIAGYGHIHILDYFANLKEKYFTSKFENSEGERSLLPTSSAYCFAAALGNLEVMEWLYAHEIEIPDDSHEIEWYDGVNMFSTLIVKDKDIGFEWQNGLSPSGLESNRVQSEESYKLSAIVYEWLINHGMPITDWMFGEAGNVGNIHMLNFLEQKGAAPNMVAMDNVCAGGHINILNWFAERDILPNVYDIREGIDNVEVIKWAVDHNIGPSKDWVIFACTSDSIDVLDYLETLGNLPDNEDAYRIEYNKLYSRKKSYKCLQWMADRGIYSQTLPHK